MTPLNTTSTTYNPLRNERGETLFYTLVGIPILFGFCMLSLDLGSWQSQRQYLQKEADRIVLHAAQFLPDEESSREYLAQEVSLLKELSDNNLKHQVKSNTSRIDLSLSSETATFFDIFLQAKTKKKTLLSARASSSAAVIPSDYVLVVSDAASMRPVAHKTWGDEDDWPESSYFKLASAPLLSSVDDQEGSNYWPGWWKEDFEIKSFKRWATQQCYNPNYSALKFAAISLIDRFLREKTSRLSLLFTPGDSENGIGFSLARDLKFNYEVGSQYWSRYYKEMSATSDEACVYFSDQKTARDGYYRFPQQLRDVSTGATEVCEQIFEATPLEDGYGHLPDPSLNRLSSCFTSSGIGLQEIVYYHAARSHNHESDAGNIVNTVSAAIFQLAEDSEENLEFVESQRGNLASRAKKEIIVIVDDLPSVANIEFSEMLKNISKFPRLSLSYIVFAHDGLEEDKRNLILRTFQEVSEIKQQNFSIYLARNETELSNLVLFLQKKGKQTAIVS